MIYKQCRCPEISECPHPWWGQSRGVKVSLRKWAKVPIPDMETAYDVFLKFERWVLAGCPAGYAGECGDEDGDSAAGVRPVAIGKESSYLRYSFSARRNVTCSFRSETGRSPAAGRLGPFVFRGSQLPLMDQCFTGSSC